MNVSDEIKRLHELHLAGALTDSEFIRAKEKVLAGSTVNLNKTIGDGSITAEFSRLRRSRTDRWLGGVCGGIAVASGIDAWIWRLVFALFGVTYGVGILIYVLLWVFVPEESGIQSTPAER
ncbi:PspC domain-containing protein [Massilia sp. S19_KUP03_FR1]|uniref:PspC domain-containing protein n=1 Tax=Massilia sp. S19_KUP03_FR1 TaxID=3025503 RepID=UPI002FCD6C32